MSTPIPTIDFAPWFAPTSTPSERLAVAKSLVSAFRTVGFAQIINHDVPSSLINEAFSITKQLFDLPPEDKALAPHPPGPTVHRGYSHPGLEKVYQGFGGDKEMGEKLREVVDWKFFVSASINTLSPKESYEIGSPHNPDQPNIWLPSSLLPQFQPFMLSLYDRLFLSAREILLAIGTGLELKDPAFLRDFHSGINNQLRLLHYPPVLAKEIESGEKVRLPAHTDWGSITMVWQDGCGGLEVEKPGVNGEFISVEPREGAVVVNVGDLLMRWTNDTLKSTLHRVELPPLADRYATTPAGERITRARYSIPYFVGPDVDQTISCLPESVRVGETPKYDPVVFGEYGKMKSALQY
ncbi:thymine dioxygenase protein [Rutstroemia sp. NJR-2017a WRK4]|nr:thymine dioxygenase protein [Rutstroemia sp. NJR-2017a WRK4]